MTNNPLSLVFTQPTFNLILIFDLKQPFNKFFSLVSR